METEFLEQRTLLATIPAAIPTTAVPINLTGLSSVSSQGNANNPVVAIDPLDTSKMIAVWGVDLSPLSPAPDPNAIIEGAYSTDAGQPGLDIQRWPGLAGPDRLSRHRTLPPTRSRPIPASASIATATSMCWSRSITPATPAAQSSWRSTTSLVAPRRPCTLSNSRPPTAPFGVPSNYNVLYQWVTTSDAAVYPTMLVDNNVASFTDPTTNNVQSDPTRKINTNPNPGLYSDVYVAWASIDQKPSADTDTAALQPQPDQAGRLVRRRQQLHRQSDRQ